MWYLGGGRDDREADGGSRGFRETTYGAEDAGQGSRRDWSAEVDIS